MWMARRSSTKSKYPNMLDHIVAGGQPHGISPMENVIKECEEEAGIPYYLACRARAASAINYCNVEPVDGNPSLYAVSRSVLFCYDLTLPSDFVPKVVDGEVHEFFTWDLDQVALSLDPDYVDPIKPNCYLVIIDYMLRMGYVQPDTPGYLDVLTGLRTEDCR